MALEASVKSLADFDVGKAHGPTLVYLDISIADQPLRRLHIEVFDTKPSVLVAFYSSRVRVWLLKLFDEELPLATSNFRMLCTGLVLGPELLVPHPDTNPAGLNGRRA